MAAYDPHRRAAREHRKVRRVGAELSDVDSAASLTAAGVHAMRSQCERSACSEQAQDTPVRAPRRKRTVPYSADDRRFLDELPPHWAVFDARG